MLALSVVLFTRLLAQTSALHVQPRSPPHAYTPSHLPFLADHGDVMMDLSNPGATYDDKGNVIDPGDHIWTKGSDEHAKLPEIYGEDRPRVLGLTHCQKFQESVPFDERGWGIAGMPNSGTNALFALMSKNCAFRSKAHREAGWEVPWSKHSLLDQRHANATYRKIMAVVLTKDPVQWMASTCRKSYFNVNGVIGNDRCPSPVNKTNGLYMMEEAGGSFDSLIDIWGKWHSEYFQNYASQRQPALMIRFEDLLFKPEATITHVCGCLGLKSRSGKDFQILESIPKWGAGHGQPTNRSQTLNHYTKKREAILSRITKEDADYMRRSAAKMKAEGVMRHFHYSPTDWEAHTARNLGRGLSSHNEEYDSQLLATSDWGDEDE